MSKDKVKSESRKRMGLEIKNCIQCGLLTMRCKCNHKDGKDVKIFSNMIGVMVPTDCPLDMWEGPNEQD